jgi:hypothetical protein
MPQPFKKLPKPPPGAVTVRRIGVVEPVEVVAPDELERRKAEAEWQRYRRTHGLDLTDEHKRLALRLGDTITVPSYAGELWWFVRDVDGIDRTIAAGTLIFDQPRERTFPFELTEPFTPWPIQRNEAQWWWEQIQARLGPVRKSCAERAS